MAADTAEQVKEKAQEATHQATEQARGQVRSQVEQRSNQAGEQVTSTASDIRSVAEQLRQQGKDQPARLAEQAADRAERLGSYLTESNADRILHDVEDLARRQPWAVVGAGLFLGFAASRLLKASSSDRYQQRSTGQDGLYRPGTQVIEPAPQASPARFDRNGV